MAKRTFETLNGLRGLAALLVVMFHAAAWFGPLAPVHGALCVDLFFLMSGFVVAYAYEPRLAAGMGSGAFVLARLIRLYPLYLFGFLIAVCAYVVGVMTGMQDKHELGTLATYGLFQVFMLPSPTFHERIPSLFPFNDSSWSMFFEIAINILYVFSWRLWTKRVLAVVAVVVGAIMLADPAFHGDGGHLWPDAYQGLLRTAFSFPLGVLIYRHLDWIERFVPRLNGVAVALCLPLMLAIITLYSWQICVFVGFPILLMAAITARSGPAAGWALNRLGNASYAIYAIHMPLLFMINDLIAYRHAKLNMMAFGFAFLALITIGSLVLDMLYDNPVRRLLARRLLNREPREG